MGRDKALVVLDGVPLAGRVAAVLRDAGAEPVLAIGGDLPGLRAAGLEAVSDPHEGAGPLGGIAAALSLIGDRDVMVVLACDLVSASPLAVAAVVDALRAAPDAAAAVPMVGGKMEPLHAAWRSSALGAVHEALASGDRAVHGVLARLGAVPVEGLESAWFANVNTPGELDSATVGHTGGMAEGVVPEIEVDEMARRHAAGGYVLDVRRQDEYDAGHVPGAVLLPLDQLEARRSEVPADRPILVICKSGARSAAAVQALVAAGYDATNIAGGTMAWMDAGHPVVEGPTPG
jgi:molybdopterin-guanine dinucleotide biosynthesis protein A/rhodanese-related sulfurtransferase